MSVGHVWEGSVVVVNSFTVDLIRYQAAKLQSCKVTKIINIQVTNCSNGATNVPCYQATRLSNFMFQQRKYELLTVFWLPISW